MDTVVARAVSNKRPGRGSSTIPSNTNVWILDPNMQMRGGAATADPRRTRAGTAFAASRHWPSRCRPQLSKSSAARGCQRSLGLRVRAGARMGNATQEAGPTVWLVIRRSLAERPEVKYYVSNADESTPLSKVALVTGMR